MFYGYFSQQSINKGFGSCIYSTPDGREVEVTSIGTTSDPKDSGYMWKDTVVIGQVVEWVRDGKKETRDYKIKD